MGRYLSADFGFGIVLPTGEDEDWTPPEEFASWFEQFIDWDENEKEDFDEHGWEWVSPDWYEVGEALEKEFPVKFLYSYVEDYDAGKVVVAASTKQDVDYIGAVDTSHLPSFEEMEALAEIAKRFGATFDPRWVVAVSYG